MIDYTTFDIISIMYNKINHLQTLVIDRNQKYIKINDDIVQINDFNIKHLIDEINMLNLTYEYANSIDSTEIIIDIIENNNRKKIKVSSKNNINFLKFIESLGDINA